MKRLAPAAIVIALMLPAAAVGHSATISGGTANADWTLGSVDNIIVLMDDCGTDQESCQWAAVAGVMPMASGYCPADWDAGQAAGLQVVWSSAEQTGDVAIQSGAREFALNGTAGQRVCVYVERVGQSELWFSKLLKASPPADAPALSEAAASDEARRMLRKRYGKRFRKGSAKKLDCAETTRTEYDCSVKWRYRDHRYAGHVVVTMSADGQVAAKIDVRRK